MSKAKCHLKLQIRILASQMYPTNSAFLIKSYESATEEPYTHFFMDLSNDCPENIRIRSNIFDKQIIVYQPTKET